MEEKGKDRKKEGGRGYKGYDLYVTHPHDALIKDILGKEKNAIEFFKKYLKEEIRDILDLETLKVERGTFISEELKEYYTDILYKVKMKSEEVYMYVLVEHKSYYERFLPLQLLSYMVKIWEREIEEKRRERRERSREVQEDIGRQEPIELTFILPIVIYHGELRVEFISLEDIVRVPKPELKMYVPEVRYIIYDVVRMSDEEIKQAEPEVKILLWLFKYIRSKKLDEKLTELLKTMEITEEERDLLIKMGIYLLSIGDISPERYVELVREHVKHEVGGELMGYLQILIQKAKEEGIEEGRRKGIEEGRRKGIEEGRRKGKIEAIEIGLEMRFGEEGLKLMREIKEIKELDKLERLKNKLKSAKTLQEFKIELEKMRQSK